MLDQSTKAQKEETMWTEYDWTIELTEPMLGTIPKDKEVFTSHVRDHERGADDEIPPGEIEERGWTSFYTDEQGRPVLMDYQVKGFLKEAANTLKDSLGLKALRNNLDSTLFVTPRRTVLADHVGEPLERPLRAQTMQGPRVTVVRSDTIPAGNRYTFRLRVLKSSKITEEVLRHIVAYGELKGLGQWRNGGYGRFSSTLEKVGG